jgi:hypothetical protein
MHFAISHPHSAIGHQRPSTAINGNQQQSAIRTRQSAINGHQQHAGLHPTPGSKTVAHTSGYFGKFPKV